MKKWQRFYIMVDTNCKMNNLEIIFGGHSGKDLVLNLRGRAALGP